MLKRLVAQLSGRKRGAPPAFAGPEVLSEIISLQTAGKVAQAEHLCRAYSEADKSNADLTHLLASILLIQSRYAEAMEAMEAVTAQQPLNADAWHHMGVAASGLGRNTLAESSYRQALQLRPQFIDAMNNLATVLRRKPDIDEAELWYRRVLDSRPEAAETMYNLGRLLAADGRMREAIEWHRRATIADPSAVDYHSNLIYWLNFDPAYSPLEVFAAHQEWARAHTEPLARTAKKPAVPATAHRQLRVGYVSPNFRDHAAGHFFESTLAAHDRQQFHTVGYSDVAASDRHTANFRQLFGEWRECASLSDAELADRIERDRVDILVDLTGHTQGNRLLTFAKKPAPITITWNGYANTTGMTAMDYRITDPLADPPGLTEHLHTEKLLRMPETYMVFSAPPASPPVNLLPALTNGAITFGSFNAVTKLNSSVINLWAEILRAAPAARLLIATVPSANARARLTVMFGERGIAPSRLSLRGQLPRAGFFALHHEVDIALDPFPFNGTTTTCDSLWMGLPVVTLAGSSHVSRVGVSMLTNVGLPQLAATSKQGYAAIAIALASDLPALQVLRAGLRARMLASPLMDAPRFSRHLENAYRSIWQSYCHAQN